MGLYTKLMYRHPLAYVGKFLMGTSLLLLLLIIQIQVRKWDNSHLVPKTKAASMALIFLTHVTPILTLVKGYEDNQMIYAQCRNGMGKPLAYFLVTIMTDFSLVAINSVVQVCIAAAVINLDADSIPSLTLTVVLLTCIIEMVARFYALEDNKIMGLINYFSYFSNEFMFMGMGLQPTQTSWVFRWMFYIFPAWWANQNLYYSNLHWITLNGAESCSNAGDPSCKYNFEDGVVMLPGWKCTDGTGNHNCWGHTGDQALKSLHDVYEASSDDDNLGRNWGILAGFAGLFMLLFLKGLVANCSKVCTLETKSNDEGNTKANKKSDSPKRDTEGDDLVPLAV
jgi:hypothetical protein